MSIRSTHGQFGEGHGCPSRSSVRWPRTQKPETMGLLLANGSYRFGAVALCADLAGDPASSGPGP
ncbi:hypothetical protein L6R52_09905 [Myxococcota bacterium]|nr:hypothetical protein [Myxococcota bacterium]